MAAEKLPTQATGANIRSAIANHADAIDDHETRIDELEAGSGGSGLALGETSTTAYRGDRGKTAYDHSQITTGNPHGTTKTDLGLNNVDNTSDSNKPLSSAQITALGLKLDTVTYTSGIALKVDKTAYDANNTTLNALIANKVDKVPGLGLSQESYTTAEKTKLGLIGPQSTVFLGTKTFYGAKGDAVLLLNGSTTAGSNIVNVVGANFTSADIGKSIGIPYAGADNGTQTIGQTLVGTITAINSTTSITISVNAVKTIVGARTITDGIMAVNTDVLTSATANFTSTDVGKMITIPGAGEMQSVSRPFTQTCWISSVTNATTAVVSRKALQAVTAQTITIPGAWVQYGTDDSDALQAAINDAGSRNVTLLLENSRYLTTKELVPVNNLSITGQSRASAIIAPVGFGFAAFRLDGNPFSLLRDNQYQNFTLDCYGVTVNTYGTVNKAFYMTYMLRPVFKDLLIMNSSATSIGCDFLIDYLMLNNIIVKPGRQVAEFGGGGGGSGIGIGTGAFGTEAGLVTGNRITDFGKQGIFVESQSSNVLSKGIKIIGNSCDWGGNAGIGDRATDGTIISGNTCNYNAVGIEGGVGFVAGLYSTNSIITGNTCIGNFTKGIYFEYKNGNINISNNMIDGQTTRGITAGIHIFGVTGGAMFSVTIKDNILQALQRRGMYFNGSPLNIVDIANNKIFNTGVSPSTLVPAIDVQIAITKLYVKNNIAFDTRATGSKTQSYGLSLGSVAIGQLTYYGNDFVGNATANDNLTSATITSTISTPVQ